MTGKEAKKEAAGAPTAGLSTGEDSMDHDPSPPQASPPPQGNEGPMREVVARVLEKRLHSTNSLESNLSPTSGARPSTASVDVLNENDEKTKARAAMVAQPNTQSCDGEEENGGTTTITVPFTDEDDIMPVVPVVPSSSPPTAQDYQGRPGAFRLGGSNNLRA